MGKVLFNINCSLEQIFSVLYFKGCPRCDGSVFQAEGIMESGRCYHMKCFTCKSCSKSLGDRLQAFIGFDKDLYCKTCCPKAGHTDRGTDTTKIKGHNHDETCPKCQGKVFEAEKVLTRKHCFHKSCFKCSACSTALDQSSVREDTNGEIYCKNCYGNVYFTGGRSTYLEHGGDKTRVDANDPTACLKCSTKVFEAEKVQVRAGLYHQYCLQCHQCQKQLEQTTFLEASNKHIYCAGCYSISFGVRSRSKSCGPVDYKSIKSFDITKSCQTCNGQVFEASDEKMATPIGLFHKACFRCSSCQVAMGSSPDIARRFKDKIYCRQCADREKSVTRESGIDDKADNFALSYINSEVIKATENDPDRCPKCTGKVFPAEMMTMKSGHYHSKCFTCCNCKRSLESTNACDGPNNSLFCHSCYNKYFGPLTRWFQEDKSVKTDLIISSKSKMQS
jgi:hypothetical protein